jgi:hypothetical protein
MKSFSTTVDVSIDIRDILDDIDDDTLIEELERRGADYNTKGVDGDDNRLILEAVWHKRRTGQDYQAELDQLIWNIVGRIS